MQGRRFFVWPRQMRPHGTNSFRAPNYRSHLIRPGPNCRSGPIFHTTHAPNHARPFLAPVSHRPFPVHPSGDPDCRPGQSPATGTPRPRHSGVSRSSPYPVSNTRDSIADPLPHPHPEPAVPLRNPSSGKQNPDGRPIDLKKFLITNLSFDLKPQSAIFITKKQHTNLEKGDS